MYFYCFGEMHADYRIKSNRKFFKTFIASRVQETRKTCRYREINKRLVIIKI